ncbi:MAG: septation protein SpoVG family protein [Planctomycetota bacterium]
MLKNVQFRAVEQGSFKAEVRVTIGDIQINGFKVLQDDKGGLWVGAPSKSFQKKDGTTGYQSIVLFADPAKRQSFQEEVLAEYERFRTAEGKPPERPPAQASARPRTGVPAGA